MSRTSGTTTMIVSSRPTLSTHFAITRRNLRSMSMFGEDSSRSGVTIVEVLFAMFVVLFGLVGLVVLLPLAGRQASDSYALTHASATMENSAAELFSSKTYEPTPNRPWWFHDDDYATAPIANQNFGFPYDHQRRWYRSAKSMQEMMWFVQQRQLWLPSTSVSQSQEELARRNGRAQGFCIDPQFCASELQEAWTSSSAYQHGRWSPNQGIFRRSRMPFFDETVNLNPTNNLVLGATSYPLTPTTPFYPKLLRVSFSSAGTVPSRPWGTDPREPLPVPKSAASLVASSLGDITAADAVEDKSFGSLRFFSTSGTDLISSPTSNRISWLATITPSEQSSPGTNPTDFNLSLVLFSNRELMFDAAPPAVTGSDMFAKNEKMCFATSPTAGSSNLTSLGDLAFSHEGGTLEVQLWSDPLMDATIRIGDWIMLSRRIVLGNVAAAVDRVQIIHRHRWYRVIGTDNAEVWPRTIRLAGEPWDYPEMNAVMYSGNSSGSLPAYSVDGKSSFPGPNATIAGGALTFDDLATTATIFRNVVSVYKRTVTLE